MHPLAQQLNATIEAGSPAIFSMLSARGRSIFFPKGGILGQTAEAKGKRFNATIGIATEDDGSPMRLPSLAQQIALDPKDVFPYDSSYGKKELRSLWQEMIRDKNPSLGEATISLPVVTAALTHALSMVAYMFLDPTDELIVTDKFWGNYNLMFTETYGVGLKTFNTFTSEGFDVAAFKAALSGPESKKVVLLNFPNNPSGYTLTEVEVEKVVEVIEERAQAGDHLAIVLDDAYFGLVYEEEVYRESLFARLADLHENVLAVKVDGATKEDYVWGFRVGCITYAARGITADVCSALEDKTAGAVRGTISFPPHISQSYLLQLYQSPTYAAEKQAKYEVLKARYECVKEVLGQPGMTDYFRPLPFNSGYFMCVELADSLDGEAVRKLLLAEFDTGVIAVGNLLRIAYSCLPVTDIETLFTNLRAACAQLASSTPST